MVEQQITYLFIIYLFILQSLILWLTYKSDMQIHHWNLNCYLRGQDLVPSQHSRNFPLEWKLHEAELCLSWLFPNISNRSTLNECRLAFSSLLLNKQTNKHTCKKKPKFFFSSNNKPLSCHHLDTFQIRIPSLWEGGIKLDIHAAGPAPMIHLIQRLCVSSVLTTIQVGSINLKQTTTKKIVFQEWKINVIWNQYLWSCD